MRVEMIEREILSWMVTDPKKYLKVGKRLHELGKDVHAIPYLKKGLTYDPESKELHKTLGDVYVNLDNLREADAHYSKVVEIDSKCAKSWARLASISLKRGDVHRADVASAKALMLNRRDPFNWLVKANVFRRLGLTDHANTCYFLATDGRKKLGEAWAGLVTTYEDLGCPSLAAYYLEKGLKKCKKDPTMILLKVEKLIDEWQLKVAEELLRSKYLRSNDVDLAGLYFLRGKVHMMAKRYRDALGWLRMATGKAKRNSEYRLLLAECLGRLGEYNEAAMALAVVEIDGPKNEKIGKVREIISWEVYKEKYQHLH